MSESEKKEPKNDKKKEEEKSKRCVVKKRWTNMKCECGKICCIFYLKRELHKCEIIHINVNKDYSETISNFSKLNII